MLLPFCTPGLSDPHAWLFPSLNKVSPTGSGREKGARMGVEGGGKVHEDRDPSAPTRGQPPRSPQLLPLACPAAAAKPGNASRKKEIRFPTEPGKLLNRNRKSQRLG